VKNVLIICRANTCRSVMAQVLLEKLLAERHPDAAVRVGSAAVGPHARDGMIPSLDARLVLREDGIRLGEETIVSRALAYHPDLLAEADLIVAMTAEQKTMLDQFSEADGRPRFTLRELAGESGDIEDPYGQAEDRYRQCRDEIRRCLERSLGRLLAALEGGVVEGRPRGGS
jgi:protein-tyrosine phosphatase